MVNKEQIFSINNNRPNCEVSKRDDSIAERKKHSVQRRESHVKQNEVFSKGKEVWFVGKDYNFSMNLINGVVSNIRRLRKIFCLLEKELKKAEKIGWKE